ncbi:MAG: hypothetical protein IPG22_06515 [Acidobacteria bacterium]|jgi:hypothetical protein|nr:hypothetical protein [Acidobacteriota bacterium]
MAVTQSDIDALNAAIASGEKQVALGAQQVTYRSINELIAARNDLQARLDAENAAAVKSKQTKLYYAGRGY